jgi:hypothetical protein
MQEGSMLSGKNEFAIVLIHLFVTLFTSLAVNCEVALSARMVIMPVVTSAKSEAKMIHLFAHVSPPVINVNSIPSVMV